MPKPVPVPLVDLSAREGHFLDHLAPVWRALPSEHRGTIHVSSEALASRARTIGLEGTVVVGELLRGKELGPALVASYGDLRVASRCRRPVVLFEHGAGQSYGGRHKSYVGGTERERVRLFVVPNEQAAARNRRYYPGIPNAVVGSPRVDELVRIAAPGKDRTTAAISFHWRCEVAPETGSAIDDFADELEETRRALEAQGVELIGHAHPRILEEARRLYTAAGIETVDRFEDVVARAHVYAVDNSSTLFEFAALDRPVVLLNARAYRRAANHGLRFWTEADVGLHAGPGELVATLRRALEDPADVARSRRAAVARTYSVVDGTSAERAAEAIVSTLLGGPRRCPVCGAAHASCGPVTDVRGIDQRVKERDPMAGTLKRYPNPARKGSFLKLNDADAKALGFDPATGDTRPRAAPAVDVTNPGGADLVSSGTVGGTLAAPVAPKGALIPSGPTHRARAAASSAQEPSPGPDDPDVGQEPQEGEQTATEGTSLEDETTSEPRPPSRRRRAVADNPQA